MRRSDPVKRSIWVGGFLVAITILWSVELELDCFFEKSGANRATADWNRIEAHHKEVTGWVATTDLVEAKLAGLDRLSTNRILWANVLNSLQKSWVEGVQVTHFKGNQSYTLIEAIPAKEKVKRQPAACIEKVSLTIEARDWNPEGLTYNLFKKSLSNSPYFMRHLGRGDGFELGTVSGISTERADSVQQSVAFTLECHFPEVRRDE